MVDENMKRVTHISLSNEPHEYVLSDRPLRELEELSIVESIVLEISEANEVLRIDLTEDELRKMPFQNKEVQ